MYATYTQTFQTDLLRFESDPYEVPDDAEMRIDTSDINPDEAVQRIVLKLEALGLIRPRG